MPVAETSHTALTAVSSLAQSSARPRPDGKLIRRLDYIDPWAFTSSSWFINNNSGQASKYCIQPFVDIFVSWSWLYGERIVQISTYRALPTPGIEDRLLNLLAFFDSTRRQTPFMHVIPPMALSDLPFVRSCISVRTRSDHIELGSFAIQWGATRTEFVSISRCRPMGSCTAVSGAKIPKTSPTPFTKGPTCKQFPYRPWRRFSHSRTPFGPR